MTLRAHVNHTATKFYKVGLIKLDERKITGSTTSRALAKKIVTRMLLRDLLVLPNLLVSMSLAVTYRGEQRRKFFKCIIPHVNPTRTKTMLILPIIRH